MEVKLRMIVEGLVEDEFLEEFDEVGVGFFIFVDDTMPLIELSPLIMLLAEI